MLADRLDWCAKAGMDRGGGCSMGVERDRSTGVDVAEA